MRYILIILMIIPLVSAQLEREMPDDIYIGETIEVKLRIDGAKLNEKAVISEKIPSDLSLVNWSISGVENGSVNFFFENDTFVWELIALDNPIISYYVLLPNEPMNISLLGVYALSPDLFGNSESRIEIVKKESHTSAISIIAVLVVVVLISIVFFSVYKKLQS